MSGMLYESIQELLQVVDEISKRVDMIEIEVELRKHEQKKIVDKIYSVEENNKSDSNINEINSHNIRLINKELYRNDIIIEKINENLDKLSIQFDDINKRISSIDYAVANHKHADLDIRMREIESRVHPVLTKDNVEKDQSFKCPSCLGSGKLDDVRLCRDCFGNGYFKVL